MKELTYCGKVISQDFKVTGPNQPNTAVITFEHGLVLEHIVYTNYTTSVFNKDIIISSNNMVRLASPDDTGIITAGTVIKIDQNGINLI